MMDVDDFCLWLDGVVSNFVKAAAIYDWRGERSLAERAFS